MRPAFNVRFDQLHRYDDRNRALDDVKFEDFDSTASYSYQRLSCSLMYGRVMMATPVNLQFGVEVLQYFRSGRHASNIASEHKRILFSQHGSSESQCNIVNGRSWFWIKDDVHPIHKNMTTVEHSMDNPFRFK